MLPVLYFIKPSLIDWSWGFITSKPKGMQPPLKIANMRPHPVLPQTILGGQIFTLHLKYVPDCTDPLLLLFEWTQQLRPFTTTALAAPCLGRSKLTVRLACPG